MMDATAGQKTRMVITRCDVSPGGAVTLEDVSFTVMLNPSEFTHDYTISYNTKKTLGQVGSDTKFSAINPDKINFAILIDGTGAVPSADSKAKIVDVSTQLENLSKVVYSYVGDEHQPSHVRLLWGTLIFFGRMESMSTQYTLFKPSGEALRAKVTLKFVGFMSKKQMELESNRSSPDLSHIVDVVEGDTLPLLCDRIYGDSWYYLEVAKFNRLASFRTLKPGMRLHFPPLE
jgi:Contractile injection system tube protein